MMDTLSAALEVAAGGFPVFPVKLCPDACLRCSICKAPATPHGFHDASSDPDQIRQLWSQHPGALIGMPTGEVSDVDVLDLDCAKEPAAVVWWMSHRNRIPLTRTHQSGNGGLHLLFRHHGLSRTGNGRVGPGVDVKANGGYIVWWPAYGRKLVLDVPISEWPDWLIDHQQPKIYAMPSLRAKTPQGLEGVANFVASRPEGERNCSTFWGFCRAYEAVLDGVISESEAVSTLTGAALRSGLPENEIRAIARSAKIRAGRRR
jgi:hypothetical protein